MRVRFFFQDRLCSKQDAGFPVYIVRCVMQEKIFITKIPWPLYAQRKHKGSYKWNKTSYFSFVRSTPLLQTKDGIILFLGIPNQRTFAGICRRLNYFLLRTCELETVTSKITVVPQEFVKTKEIRENIRWSHQFAEKLFENFRLRN